MAAKIQSADSSEEVIQSQRKESRSELFIPKDTLHQPCDVVLMVKDGKQLKAHRRVLSEASLFFEKLLNSDMKENQEGIVRLEMFTESVMSATLQFIYTGDVQILAEDTARELIVVADYLFLEKLKLLAGGVLVQTLNTSNCISTYYFAERYQCEVLVCKTRKFLLAYFTSIYAANRENVLNMSSREVEMWISSDELNVSAEEDVFKFILAWIDHEKSERKIFFAELFRHVRLVYVSLDFLRHDIATNELVKDNNSCLTLVKDAINLLDSKTFERLAVPPRKSLETPVVVVNVGENVLCYILRENSWCKLGTMPHSFSMTGQYVSCDGRLYRNERDPEWPYSTRHFLGVAYNPFSNSRKVLTAWEEGRWCRKIFVSNGGEMYALLTERCFIQHSVNWCHGSIDQMCGSRKHTSSLTKYKPETSSWEDVTSFNHLDLRVDFCIVANDNFIYFIGGLERRGEKKTFLSDVDRFELGRKKWDKAANTNFPKWQASGAAVNEKIYVTVPSVRWPGPARAEDWEVYDETTNEWQIIGGNRPGIEHINADVRIPLAIDGELYLVDIKVLIRRGFVGPFPNRISIERYYPEENKWQTITDVTAREAIGSNFKPAIVCPMRIFKGLFNMRQVEALPFPVATTTQASLISQKRDQNIV